MSTWLCMSAKNLRFASRLQFVLVATLLLCATLAWGQASSTGTVIGVVTDQSNAVVPGVTITLTDVNTKAELTTNTNDSGRYVFVNVPPGTYSLTATKTAFSAGKIASLAVNVGAQTTANMQLQVGTTSQTVEVTATGTELQTLNATVGNVVPAAALESLPSLGRDVSTFAALQPGVSPDGSVAGAVVDQSTFQLDGGNNTNDMDGSMQVYTPSFANDPTGLGNGLPTGVVPTPADSVEQFKVGTANQTADFNNSSGAQVQVVTRRGTNTYHGSVYEYYLDNNFSANTWDNNLVGVKQPGYHYSRFGGSFGGTLLPSMAGGKTYFFANYQGFRWPNSATIERAVPSTNMRNGILTFAGKTYNMKALDPRGIGLNPLVSKLWSQFLPAGNDPGCGALKGSRCDGVNEIGLKANVGLPQNDNFGVVRLDHDFGARFHLMSSYRYYHLTRATSDQVDIGGFFPGDKLGTPTSLSNRPQVPTYIVAGLTTNISSNTTNDMHWSYTKNWWQWGTHGGPAQLPGVGAAIEPLGESATAALVPYNVNAQQARTRFWDGHDYFLRDAITTLKGNHLLQFGGQWQRNWNYHQRTDNGGGINYYPTYLLGDSAGAGSVDMSGMAIPQSTTALRDAAAVLGIVTDSQIAITRSGSNLALNPPLTPATDKSTIPYYTVYFSDTWHMKPSFTLTYGLGWTLELPPTEQDGKQVVLTDASNQPLGAEAYLNQRKRAALQGQVYNPQVGFALVGNTANGLKYPYNPFYGSFSPRIAAAWNPQTSGEGMLGKVMGRGATVIRGGYGRIYGRLNGVQLVLVPLLSPGLIQPINCTKALSTGACGPATPTASTAFRIGVDGNNAPIDVAQQTLPQPLFPGINGTAAATAFPLDPHLRPNAVDSFDFTIQRQLGSKMTLEVGAISRWIHHEFQEVDLNAVPYMMTLGGQTFAAAYANVEKAMGCATSVNACDANGPPTVGVGGFAAQPFFEAALAGTGYCNGFKTCTDAVATKQEGNFSIQKVWSLWSALDKGGIGGGPNGTTVPGFNFARSMMNSPYASTAPCPGSSSTRACGASGQLTAGVDITTSTGHGNYNGLFASLKLNDWKGLTMQQNFTWSKAMGTGALVQASSSDSYNDAFNIDNMYGYQPFDRKFVYNLFLIETPPWFKGQQGLMGRLLGGWNFSPIFTAGSGSPLFCNTQTDAQSFGTADGAQIGTHEQCVFTSHAGTSVSVHGKVIGANGIADAVATDANGNNVPVNIYKNPVAVFNNVRAPILGIDTRIGGFAPGGIRGLPYWNMDLSVRKNFKIWERTSFEFSTVFINVLNHNQFADPTLDISDPTSWGILSSQANSPRKMEFGLRVAF